MKFTKTLQIGEMDRSQLPFLTEAWYWLQRNNLPFGGSDSSFYIFALNEDGVPVGIIETRDCDAYTWIQLVYVRLSRRRQGIGKALISEAISRVENRGQPFGLGTQPDNEAMKALAWKTGFTHEIHELWRR